MSGGINKWIGIGNCGEDASLKYSHAGTAIMSVSIAVNEVWFDQNSNEKKERVEWVPLCMFGKRAEAVSKFVKKGKQIYVEGRLQTRSWDDKDSGQKKYKTEVVVTDLQLLGSGSNGKRERQEDVGGGSESDHASDDMENIPFAVNECVTAVMFERWNRSNQRLI